MAGLARAAPLRYVGGMAGGEGARCARHSETVAELACDRCGDFVCGACLGSATALVCSLCREQTGHDRIAWERASDSVLWRYLSTARECLILPQEAGASIAHGGSLVSALVYLSTVPAVFSLAVCGFFALVSAAVVYTPSLVPGASARDMALGSAILCVLIPPVFLAVWAAHATLTTTVFHVTARVLGGNGDVTTSARATAYFSGLALWTLPALIVGFVPCFGIIVLAGMPLWLVTSFVVGMRSVARQAHGLNDGGATGAALAPVVVYAGLIALWTVAAWAS